MKVDVAHVNDIEKRVTVVLPPELVTSEIDKAYLDLKKTIRLKGFRAGKAPMALLERYFKAQVEEDVISKIVKETYPQALGETKILPISQPKIENGVLEKDKEFSYTAVFEIKPEIKVQGYEGLELEQQKAEEAQESEVEKELEALQNNYATLKDVDGRGIQKGDYALLDFESTADGKPYSGSKQKDFFLEISDKSYLPGFADQVVGLNKDEAKSFTIAIPADFPGKDLAGKTIACNAVVKGIKEKALPNLDDEFARDLGEYEGIDDLKKKLGDEITERKKMQAAAALKEKIYDALIAKNPFEVPKTLIEMQTRNMIRETQQMLAAQGIDIKKLSQNPGQLFERYKETAERQVRAALILDAIAQKEGLKVDDADFEKEYHDIAKQAGQTIEAVKAQIEREMLQPQILEKKAADFIIAKAKLSDK
ncbi:MAG: trigger factor [Pseudomonadota bacterium]